MCWFTCLIVYLFVEILKHPSLVKNYEYFPQLSYAHLFPSFTAFNPPFFLIFIGVYQTPNRFWGDEWSLTLIKDQRKFVCDLPWKRRTNSACRDCRTRFCITYFRSSVFLLFFSAVKRKHISLFTVSSYSFIIPDYNTRMSPLTKTTRCYIFEYTAVHGISCNFYRRDKHKHTLGYNLLKICNFRGGTYTDISGQRPTLSIKEPPLMVVTLCSVCMHYAWLNLTEIFVKFHAMILWRMSKELTMYFVIFVNFTHRQGQNYTSYDITWSCSSDSCRVLCLKLYVWKRPSVSLLWRDPHGEWGMLLNTNQYRFQS